jgi:hypothetical protein
MNLDEPRMSFSSPLRASLALCAFVWLGTQPGSASSHEAEWQEIAGMTRMEEHWTIAGNTARRPPAEPRSQRPDASPKANDVVVVTAPAPGQGGYVHYFVIELPDGDREIQVGIELPDGRIAWSFPELGVVVSPFMASGEMQAGKHAYPVRHLYGIRPFREEAAMIELQKNLWHRVIPWVEDATPYCALIASSGRPCVSCLGLVLRVLYPSPSGGMPALPRDFDRSGAGPGFTTDDLLLYQAGLLGKRTLAERMTRIDALALPQNLRDDLVQIVQSLETADTDEPKPDKAVRKRPSRSVSKAGSSRSPNQKKL